MGKQETKMWNLYGYVLEGDGSSGWCSFVWWGKKRNGMEVFWGHTWLEQDTLVMGPWKVGDEPRKGEPQTPKELRCYLNSLPRWDKTKYYVKMADIGMSGLVNCETGEDVPDDIATPIMLSLGFHKVGAS